ncbi:trace amine-associated receptor 2 [Biomphalaria pfeifferi]|uniref:Trace amine-associated receptor 2 n=1 Tax=Biomphalaria pfeifferi TaxID=112525 RepID=A0AAD8C573_BIOPF|nr:trace amine-associated receptor 2 [Biomphalaria pfeifferi]
MNGTNCQNVTVDLSESSLRLTSNKHLLVVMVIISCLIAAFTVGANILIIVGVLLSRRARRQQVLVSSGISSNTKLIMASFAFGHLIFGGVCMPFAIIQMVSNGAWYFGPDLCVARTYLESLMEIIGVYHVISMSVDTYIAVCQPMKYRVLTSRYAYAMLGFCWLSPATLFAAPLLLGGYRNGKEDMFDCLLQHTSCVTLYGKDTLLLVLPFAVAFPFCVVIAVYTLILRKIRLFHNNRNNRYFRKIHRKASALSTDHMKKMDSNSDDSKKKAGGNIVFTVPNVELHKSAHIDDVISNKNRNTEVIKLQNLLERNESIKKRRKLFESVEDNSKVSQPDRKWKAFPYMIVMATWFCIYWFSISVCYLYYAYQPSKTPAKNIMAICWFFYLNSVVSPIQLLRNKHLRECVWDVFKVQQIECRVFL